MKMFFPVATKLPRPLKWRIKKFIYRGRSRFCPVCDSWLQSFNPTGFPARADARCPVCWSLERQRLVWLFLGRHTDFFNGMPKKMLHLAPEHGLEARFRQLPNLDYVTADFEKSEVMIRTSITAIPFPNDSFDVTYCSHVLEHVLEDRRAMAELRRVQKRDGWTLIIVPITAEQTIEDLSITDPDERIRMFGQEDHVRRYGPDFVERLEHMGFDARLFTTQDVVDEASALRMGVSGEQLFFCTKK